MKRLLFLSFLTVALAISSCGDDEPGFTEDNLAGTWALVSSDGTSTTVTTTGGSSSTINTDIAILSSDFQLTFEQNPNKINSQIGEFTIETTQTIDGGGASSSTEVMTQFADNDTSWEIIGDILNLDYANGDQESYIIIELNNSSLKLKQETSVNVNFGGTLIETESETLSVFERQ
jgi:hypothetical protein